MSLRETYTDNFRLAPPGQEQSDWVTEVDPGVSITARGARLELQADYAFQQRFYLSNSKENGHNHSLNSNALWNVWNKELFIKAAARAAQENLSPLGQVSYSNINVTGNQTEVRQATVNPYWVRRIGSWGNLNAGYTWNRFESSDQFSVYNNESNTLNLALSNGAEFTDLGWGINYRLSQIDSSQDSFQRRETESTIGSVRYKISPTFALTGTVGYEQNDYPDAKDSSTSGTTWSFGGEWSPSPRTRVSGAFGERYFGSTYKFDASHRTRLTTWTLGYTEDVNDAPVVSTIPVSGNTAASVDRLFLSKIPDARERQVAVQTFITQNALPPSLDSPVQFQTNQVNLVKRWQGGFGMLGIRGTLLFNVFWEERSNMSVGTVTGPFDPFAISDTVKQVGYSAALSWRFTGRTAASSSIGQTRYRYPDAGREDMDKYLRLGLTHQIQPKVHGGIDVRVLDRDSDDPTAVNSDYRERAIVGTLRVVF